MLNVNKIQELCNFNDNEYKEFIHLLNHFAEEKAGFDISRYFELQNKNLFTYKDLYNLAHLIIGEYDDVFIEKGIHLLEYIESVSDKKK